MRFQYSTRPPLNPVSQPFISRVSGPVADLCASPGDRPTDGCDDLKPPAATPSKCHLFIRCFARSLLVRKATPTPQQLRELASPSRNPQVRSTGGK